jgi:trans-aconitate 2-methyltransferase
MFQFLLRIVFTLSLVASCLSASEGVRDAKDYNKNSSLQWKWAMESLEAFPFQEGDQVLDVGCGDGSITANIAAKVPFGIVVGLDISEEMIAYARIHHLSPNIVYMQGDARKLPFIGQFDKAVAFLSLNWIKEQEQTLSSIYAALKPGGKAIITRPGKQPTNLGPLAETLIKTTRWERYFPNFEQKRHYYSLDEYADLLENAGFIIEIISEEATSTFFKDREALIGFFRPLCNFIEHLSLELQREFVEEIVDAVLDVHPSFPDGSIQLHDLKQEVIVSKPLLK